MLLHHTMYRPAESALWCQCCQQRVALPYLEGSPNFLRDHDSPQIVHSSDNSCCGARHLPASAVLLGICRPLPLAQVASSATGSAPIAPQLPSYIFLLFCRGAKPPLCKGRWLPEGQTEGLTAERWAPGNPPGEKSLIFHPAPFAQGGHGGAAKGFTQGGHGGVAKGFTQGGHGSGSGFTQGGNRGAELTPQEKQLQTIWHNIERYDGTAAGQKEVTENFGFT